MNSMNMTRLEDKGRKLLGVRQWKVGKHPLLALLVLVQLSVWGMGNCEKSHEDEMKCVCDGGCEHLRETDCPWGLSLDVCACCFICARGENEPCGGPLGTCAYGLSCRLNPVNGQNDTVPGEGTCTREKRGCEEVETRSGCVVHAGDCICGERSACSLKVIPAEVNENELRNSCRSRIAFLVARKDLELQSSSLSATDECLGVECPEVSECPADSYRLPSLVDPHPGCCPPVTKCQCNPGLLCPPPQCPSGWSKNLVLGNGTGLPGNCCPLYECVQDKGGNEMLVECLYKGKAHLSGDSWRNEEDCSDCFCNYGVTSCKPVKCDHPTDCRLGRGSSDSDCCPVCIGCVGSSGLVYNNTDVWKEDACTTCECVQGRAKCLASMCQTTCLNPTHVPGECCPRCESESRAECPYFQCDQDCAHGFQLDEKGCPICKCNKCGSLADCALECRYGYETNEEGCAVCECREETSRESPVLSGSVWDNKVSKTRKCVRTSDGVPRLDGEEWSDSCRHCICKEGTEMCSLITCPAPTCEHPIFYSGDCCPTCPDERRGGFHQAPVSICQSLDGRHHLEGEVWKLGNCLTCTCHYGQVLCRSLECPPAPCAHSLIETDGDCCLTCSSSSGGTNDGNAITNSSNDSLKLNCLSDDSHKAYRDGEMWKVGACQSCICQNGQIQCFSGGKCPVLDCDRPVLAKNQCCPVCLKSGKPEVKTKSYDPSLCNERNQTYVDGETWNEDPCTRCSCRHGQIRCVETVCSPPACASPIGVPGTCCPICSDPELKSRKQPILPDSPRFGVSDDQTGMKDEPGLRTHLSPRGEGSGEEQKGSGGLEPHCALIIAALLGISLLLLIYVGRACWFRRRACRIKKAPFHASNSSTSPPVTPDCCYKYTSCAQVSEQRTPLCLNTSTSTSSSTGNGNTQSHSLILRSDKV